MKQNDAFPLAVDQVERRLHRAARPMGKILPFHLIFSNSIQTGTSYPNLQYLPFERQRDSYAPSAKWRAGMKAVGYRKSLPIDAADALIDFETAKPEPKGRDIRVAVKTISANPVDYKVRKRAAPPEGETKILGYDAAA